MNIEEFNKKYLFHSGYCCGNCEHYWPSEIESNGVSYRLDHGRCNHADMPVGETVVPANAYCTAFKNQSVWGEDRAGDNLKEFLIKSNEKWMKEHPEEVEKTTEAEIKEDKQ